LKPISSFERLGCSSLPQKTFSLVSDYSRHPPWLSYIATPPFPGYVSGHSTTSGAASPVLAACFPSRAGELDAMAEEAAVSRLYAGIHFLSDNEAGLELGRRVGSVAVRAYGVQDR
jgi:membrane-associated phospholipid phosphatase